MPYYGFQNPYNSRVSEVDCLKLFEERRKLKCLNG